MSVALPPASGDDARRYLEAARAAALPTAGPLGSAPRPVAAAAVIGGGTMGTGIALALAAAHIAVTVVEPDAAQRERARATIERTYAGAVAKGRVPAPVALSQQAHITFVAGIDAGLHAVDLVIEAVVEDLDVKRNVFEALDRATRPHTLLASNTSTLDIDALGAATTRPEHVFGLHFFSPAHIMPLLEIVRGAATSAKTMAAAAGLSRQLGKIGVIAGNADGFIGNRMLYRFRRQAEFLLEDGALPHEVDGALRAFGFAMGPFAVSDLAGLDIGWRVRRRRNAQRPPAGRYSCIADRLCELGRFGQKSGAGYYRYAAGSRVPHTDPLVTRLILDASRDAGIARRPITDREIVIRCVYALVNEAAALLADGIAERAGDIDLVWVHGYGFPAARGGPLYYADGVGLAAVVADMQALAHVHGDDWTPAPLLARLAAAGERFTGATPATPSRRT